MEYLSRLECRRVMMPYERAVHSFRACHVRDSGASSVRDSIRSYVMFGSIEMRQQS